MKLNRNKGDEMISDEAVKRFCKEIREDIDHLEYMVSRT